MTTTDSELNFMNSDRRRGGSERETDQFSGPTPASEVTVRDPWWWRLRDYFTPPELFTDRPASIPELAAYAHRGDWTRQQYGALRAAGIWWWRLVGYPKTVRHRFAEWLWQRPGRAVTAVLLVKLLSLTTPGAYVVDQLIEPVVHAAIWLFL